MSFLIYNSNAVEIISFETLSLMHLSNQAQDFAIIYTLDESKLLELSLIDPDDGNSGLYRTPIIVMV